MIRQLAVIAAAVCLPLWGQLPKVAAPLVTSEHVDFAPGGTVRVDGSTGQLHVEGWDLPAVEITVTRSTYRTDTPQKHEQARRQLEAIRVTEEKQGTNLSIHTAFPPRGLWARLTHVPDVQMNYRIRVPRDSNLVIRHNSGDVTLYDVAGSIDATARSADILLQLPEPNQYAFDIKCRLGGVYSDFPGTYRRVHWIGERYMQALPAPSHRAYLRVGSGGISIQKMAAKVRVATIP